SARSTLDPELHHRSGRRNRDRHHCLSVRNAASREDRDVLRTRTPAGELPCNNSPIATIDRVGSCGSGDPAPTRKIALEVLGQLYGDNPPKNVCGLRIESKLRSAEYHRRVAIEE